MREEDVDLLLGSWDERLRRVDENLIALEGEPTYQMLAGGARAGLVGTTKARVVPALDALADLFDHREKLSQVVARARALKTELGFWNKDEKLAEIEALLGGRSISLGTRQLPVSQRNLLDPANTELAIVPEELLGEMVRAYQLARDAVAVVGAAWTRLEPEIVRLEGDVLALQKDATELGIGADVGRDLASIETELARVRRLVSTDPLAVVGSIDATLSPRLAELASKVLELKNHKASASRGLAEVDAILAELRTAEALATEAAARARREIAGFEVSASARTARQEIREGLLPWREKITRAAEAGHWKAADVGLARWLEVAHGVLAAEREVVRMAQAGEQRRVELQGRLGARKAQASALLARGVVAPPTLDALAIEAEATLRTRPLDLEKATRDIERYEGAVRALAPRP